MIVDDRLVIAVDTVYTHWQLHTHKYTRMCKYIYIFVLLGIIKRKKKNDEKKTPNKIVYSQHILFSRSSCKHIINIVCTHIALL